MSQRTNVLVACGAVAVVAIGGYLFLRNPGGEALQRREGPEFEAETASWIDVLDERGKNGMWLVTRGYHPGDDTVAIATQSPLSHASVLDIEKMEVIEAIGGGVKVTGLDKFLRETHRLLLIEPDGWNSDKGSDAVAKSRGQVGRGYDFLGVLGAPDEERWYCSELAAWSMGIEVNRKGPLRVIHPRDMHEYGKVLFDSGGRDGKPDS